MYMFFVCIVVYLWGAASLWYSACLLTYLLVFCLKICVKEVFQDLSQWKFRLVIVHVYVCSCLQPLAQHLHCTPAVKQTINYYYYILVAGKYPTLHRYGMLTYICT